MFKSLSLTKRRNSARHNLTQYKQPSLRNVIISAFFARQRGYSAYRSANLPVLKNFLEKSLEANLNQPLKNTAVVYAHHPLRTSVDLIKAIIRLGINSNNFFTVGKHYSECERVVREIEDLGVQYQHCSKQIGLGKFSQSFSRDINWLWSHVVNDLKSKKHIDKLIVLDHGGHALSYLPPELLKMQIVGIEKTMGGLFNLEREGFPPFPVIGVANCAAKRFLESPLIADAVVKKLLPLIPIKKANLTCGVVGYGAIGKAVTDKLISMGYKVIVYDSDSNQLSSSKDEKNMVVTNNLSTLVAVSDYIFGCTGRDIAASNIDSFRLATNKKTLISCSSEDVEFLSLLQIVQRRENGKVAVKPLADVIYRSDMGAEIKILRGGFPINFDNTGESVPGKDIQLTRALVLAGILQAGQLFNDPELLNSGCLYALDPSLQKHIAGDWLKRQTSDRFSLKTIENFKDKQWIIEASGGISLPNTFLANIFDEVDDFSLKLKR